MEQDILKANEIALNDYPKTSTKFFDYGTSGFRDKAKELGFIAYRIGLIAVLKSKSDYGLTVGLMITASHNPEEDNGIKLCGPLGQMIDPEWEKHAIELVNASNEEFMEVLKKIASTIKWEKSSRVYLARDTRSSSESLAEAAIAGIKALGSEYTDFGLLTTPQLHYIVLCQNYHIYGEASPEGYYKKLSRAIERMRRYRKVPGGTKYDNTLYIDCANGVGAHSMREMLKYIESPPDVHIFNDGSSGILNHMCGADYVKVEQKFPEGSEIVKGKRYASFDGDADRVVYYYCDENSTFHLLDGDKIAVLMIKYLQELIEQIGLTLAIRVVQTAYANGKSTSYIENTLKIPVVCVPTGVKHLHAEARKYDVGVYFEANGHGTVLFSNKAKKEMLALTKHKKTDIQYTAKKLMGTIDLINEAIGDGISDLLFVETILYDFDWNIQDWDAMYTEYACRQLKVKVPDRKAIETTDAERKCTKPEGLQEAIDTAVSKYPNARAFVRPSGTEDVVRVYAEAETQEHADTLAKEIVELVEKFATPSEMKEADPE